MIVLFTILVWVTEVGIVRVKVVGKGRTKGGAEFSIGVLHSDKRGVWGLDIACDEDTTSTSSFSFF